ncbi:MAG: tetratricopeptide repeat protein [Gemmatimonadetes bacterium]|nr:tetratricopeptide repeat protein [Gemmatimonadota bacterium]
MTELDIKRKATELLQKGRYDEAIAEYEALLESSKKPNPAIHNLIGDIFVKQGNFEKGFSHYLSASKAYKEEGLFHNGIAVGKKILRLDRDQTDVYAMLADLYARQGLGMDSLKFLREFARRQEEANRYPVALAAFADACEILGDFPDVHIAYGEMLERVDRLDDAAVCYENASQIYADKGWNDQAEQLTRRAKASKTGGTAHPAQGQSAVSDLMSLRTLDDSPAPAKKPAAPASKPAAPKAAAPKAPAAPAAPAETPQMWGRSDEPEGLTLDMPAASEGAPWTEYSQDKSPALPPPPPLPPKGAADPSQMFVEPDGIDVEEASPESAKVIDVGSASSLDEALAEMAALEPAAPKPAAPKAPAAPATPPARPADGLVLEGLELNAVAPAAKPASETPQPIDAESLDLTDLPGIVLPTKSARKSSGAIPAPPTPAAPAARAPSAEVPAPPAPPKARQSSQSVPRPEVPASTAPAPSGSFSEEELTEFFDQTSAEREHTVVIGDDFELLREGGDVNEVIADFREATMEILDLDDFQAHYDLGTTYLEMELFDEAAAEFELSSRGDAYALASQEMLGYCFLRKGQLDVAVKELEKGLALPGDERDKLGLLYNLGIACGVLDQEQEAISYFQKILELDPEFRDTKSRLERLVQSSA